MLYFPTFTGGIALFSEWTWYRKCHNYLRRITYTYHRFLSGFSIDGSSFQCDRRKNYAYEDRPNDRDKTHVDSSFSQNKKMIGLVLGSDPRSFLSFFFSLFLFLSFICRKCKDWSINTYEWSTPLIIFKNDVILSLDIFYSPSNHCTYGKLILKTNSKGIFRRTFQKKDNTNLWN